MIKRHRRKPARPRAHSHQPASRSPDYYQWVRRIEDGAWLAFAGRHKGKAIHWIPISPAEVKRYGLAPPPRDSEGSPTSTEGSISEDTARLIAKLREGADELSQRNESPRQGLMKSLMENPLIEQDTTDTLTAVNATVRFVQEWYCPEKVGG